ncbi:MAG: hypothetical protein ACR2NZ_02420 [Rubripirellula sp.]
MNKLRRREAMFLMAGGTVAIAGCGTSSVSETVSQTVAEASTESLQNTRIGLRGFQIVAFTVGKRVVQLPHPAIRILGIALVSTATVTFLAIEYLDEELSKRRIREELTQQERSEIESGLAVAFKTENGFEETVALGPNQYESAS